MVSRTAMNVAATEFRRPAWLDAADGFLLDMDGTLVAAGRPLPGAAELLAAVEGRFVIVSNNSTDVASGLARKLNRMGLPVSPEQILLAGETAVRWLAEHRPGLRILLLGSTSLHRLARNLGLQLGEDSPDLVLLARDVRFGYRRLCQVGNMLRHGAELMVTNPDLTHPGAMPPEIVPETGALMQALVACSGVEPSMIFGKPETPLLEEGLRRLGISAAAATMIGDNADTDFRGAARLGIPCLLVGSGACVHASTPAGLLRYPGLATAPTEATNTPGRFINSA